MFILRNSKNSKHWHRHTNNRRSFTSHFFPHFRQFRVHLLKFKKKNYMKTKHPRLSKEYSPRYFFYKIATCHIYSISLHFYLIIRRFGSLKDVPKREKIKNELNRFDKWNRSRFLFKIAKVSYVLFLNLFIRSQHLLCNTQTKPRFITSSNGSLRVRAFQGTRACSGLRHGFRFLSLSENTVATMGRFYNLLKLTFFYTLDAEMSGETVQQPLLHCSRLYNFHFTLGNLFGRRSNFPLLRFSLYPLLRYVGRWNCADNVIR